MAGLSGAPAVRFDGRRPDQLRPVELDRDFTKFAAGSVLVRMGRTAVLCTASFSEEPPRWLKGTGKGWVTAEYSMLPGSSPDRVDREAARGRQSGRTQEIQRLIGRSLRAVTDLSVLVDQQVTLDCDVLQADGGTRTASIVGAWVALHDACTRMVAARRLAAHPVREGCAAVSVGMVGKTPMLDLAYVEDSGAEVDMNVVMTGSGGLVEVQGTAEGAAFTRQQLDDMLSLASVGIAQLLAAQAQVIGTPPPQRDPRGLPARG
jgi:ribonuclease PH